MTPARGVGTRGCATRARNKARSAATEYRNTRRWACARNTFARYLVRAANPTTAGFGVDHGSGGYKPSTFFAPTLRISFPYCSCESSAPHMGRCIEARWAEVDSCRETLDASRTARSLKPTSGLDMRSTACLQALSLLLAPALKQGGSGPGPLRHASPAASHGSRRRSWLKERNYKAKSLCYSERCIRVRRTEPRGRAGGGRWVTQATSHLSLAENEGPRTINGSTGACYGPSNYRSAPGRTWARILTCLASAPPFHPPSLVFSLETQERSDAAHLSRPPHQAPLVPRPRKCRLASSPLTGEQPKH